MFPDSESLVMHLTAALLSSAGIQVLKKLKANGLGSPNTVGVFSKSAVLAVAGVDLGEPVTMINRTLEVDTSQPRDHTGRYPATGRIIEKYHNVNHIVVVLGHRDSGELNVITCFPSAQTTQQSIGTITSDKQDIAELEFGIHTLVDIDKNIVLYW
ncbi:MAG: hypothetical protein CENE_02918 [Candidatus Celerinatantimonas neptuna]|nr:MAG: hypothetical protein CENE_02918 [Candidatus Celerinatantimonas neptuna]